MSYSKEMIDAIQNEELEKAEHLLDQAIAGDSDEDLFALVETLFDLGFLNQTKQVVQHLLTAHPDEEGLKLTLAEIAIEEGNELEAFEWIEKVDKDSPYYVQALLVSADYYQVLNLPEVARQKLEEARALLPEEPVIEFALGELLFASGKYKEAITHYEKLIVTNHIEFAGTSLNGRLGNAYAAIGDLDSAIDYLKEAVDLQETSDHLFQLGLVYFQKKDYDTANSHFFKVKELDPSYTSVYSYLAKGFLELADEKRALEQVEEGLFYDRQNASLYAMGAEAAKILGDADKARHFYQEAIALDPDNVTMILEYLQVLFGQQAFEEALAVFEPVLESGEEDPQLFWYAAVAYNEEEAFEEARDYYDKAAVYLSDNADFLKDYAVFLREDGDRAGFINTARRYLELKPDDMEVREWIKYEDTL